jgi:hypothetical protein
MGGSVEAGASSNEPLVKHEVGVAALEGAYTQYGSLQLQLVLESQKNFHLMHDNCSLTEAVRRCAPWLLPEQPNLLLESWILTR